jgi:hypothetical protein
MWKITIDNFQGGFAPKWYDSTYPAFGNKNQAGDMQNVDLTNPSYLTQGPGLATLTAGDQTGAITTLLKGIWDGAVASDVTYGTGGNKLHKISSTAVIITSPFDDGTGGHTITHDGSELGEDVAHYQGNLYYSYNQTGAIGCIGKYDLASTFDDDWSQQAPTGKADLQSAPHQMCVGLNDRLYIANGRYVADYIGSTDTLNVTSLDLPTGTIVQSIKWLNDRLWIGANVSSLTGSNRIRSSIYIWDGVADSWEAEIPVSGRIGALYVKNGVVFVWYSDISGYYKLGYVNGSAITDIASFSGALPDYYQVTEYKDYILWNSNGLIFAYGSGDKDLPLKLFQYADGGFSTVGGLACPFGTPMVASNQSTSYKLAKFSGYDTACYWKSLMFDVLQDNKLAVLTKVIVNFEQLAANARVDLSLVNNKGTIVFTDTISNTKLGAATNYHMPLNISTENFRIQFDYTNGNTTNPVKIKNVLIYGRDS